MLKNTSHSQQFLSRSGSQATKPSSKGYSPLNWGAGEIEELEPEQQREIMNRRRAYLEGLLKSGVKNPAIGQEIFELCTRMSAIRKKVKSLNQVSLGYQFMQAAFHLLDERTYKRIYDLAAKRTQDLQERQECDTTQKAE